VCILSNDKFSVLSSKNIKGNNHFFKKIALERDREVLYPRINKRVDIMVEEGLIDEVTSLYSIYREKLKMLNIIGYAEIIDAIDGKITFEDAIESIKQNSRRYAKRQFTWFKNSKDYIWFDMDKMSEVEIIDRILNEKNCN
jgi:tRNA dimethylallyltransferase